MGKREPILRFNEADPYQIEEVILTSGVRLTNPACVPHSTIVREWSDVLQRHGWVRVASLWYSPFMQRAGSVHRAKARLKDQQERARRIGRERAAARAAEKGTKTDV